MHLNTTAQSGKNLIFIPFAFDNSKNTGTNIKKASAFDVYFKNLCVALISAKRNNIDCDVALVTNISVPEKYQKNLQKYGIITINCEFDSFVFPDNYLWSLAFYKLCALKRVVSSYNYDKYCYMDCDVIVQNTLDDIWDECDKNILLYDINHGLSVEDYRKFNSEATAFCEDYKYITHYGGEFFAANKENSLVFIGECEKVYEEIISRKFVTTIGDEMILSLSAYRLKEKIKNAGAYIFRYWTDPNFYLISTNYKYNAVSILHLPSEKNRGIKKVFEKYILKGEYPNKGKIYKCCHLCGVSVYAAKIKCFIIKKLKKI